MAALRNNPDAQLRARHIGNLPDTLTALLALWTPAELAEVPFSLCVCVRVCSDAPQVCRMVHELTTQAYVHGRFEPADEHCLWQNVFPAPDLCRPEAEDEEHRAQRTWASSLALFGRGEREAAAAHAHPAFCDWARALLLGALSLSMAARDLFFADCRDLWQRFHARSPRVRDARLFMQLLRPWLDVFAGAGYVAPDAFVRACQEHWLYGLDRLGTAPTDD